MIFGLESSLSLSIADPVHGWFRPRIIVAGLCLWLVTNIVVHAQVDVRSRDTDGVYTRLPVQRDSYWDDRDRYLDRADRDGGSERVRSDDRRDSLPQRRSARSSYDYPGEDIDRQPVNPREFGYGRSYDDSSPFDDDGESISRRIRRDDGYDPEVRRAGFFDRPIFSTSRRYQDGELPPPVGYDDGYSYGGGGGSSYGSRMNAGRWMRDLFQNPNQPMHFLADYVFLAPATTHDLGNKFHMHEVELVAQMRIPVGDRLIFSLRPFGDVLFIVGPDTGPPMLGSPLYPETLFKVAVDVQADFKFSERIGIAAAITPGLWTDFKAVGGDDFRLPARVLGTFRFTDSIYLAAGILYTDNIRRNLLPAFGAIWDMNDAWRLELLFPRSRLVFKPNDRFQAYGLVERGGDTWHIREFPGVDEQFEYRDIRLMGGVQIPLFERMQLFGEVGASINREFRFEVQPGRKVGDALVVRAGLRF